MLKNVNDTKQILEDEYNFKFKKSDKISKRTIMVSNDLEAIIEPNGSVTIGDKFYTFKEVKRRKFKF